MRRLYGRGPRARGLVVDRDGVMLGPRAVLVRRTPQGYRVTSMDDLALMTRIVFGKGAHFERLPLVLSRIAQALEAGDLVKAQLLGLEIPLDTLDDEQLKRLGVVATLVKYGLHASGPRAALAKFNPYHKPAGSPGGAGGQITNAEGTGGGSIRMADADGAGGPVLPKRGRRLHAGEIELARNIFGDRINYDCVRIHHDSDKSNPYQKTNEIVTPNGEIYYPEGNSYYRPDFSASDPDNDFCAQQYFIHEMTHVLQFQAGMDVDFRALSSKANRFYGYELDKDKAFRDYRLEQQASIIEDYSRIKQGHAPLHLGTGKDGGGRCRAMRKLSPSEKKDLLAQYQSLLKVDKNGHITAPVSDSDTATAPTGCRTSAIFIDPTAQPDDPATLPGDEPDRT